MAGVGDGDGADDVADPVLVGGEVVDAAGVGGAESIATEAGCDADADAAGGAACRRLR